MSGFGFGMSDEPPPPRRHRARLVPLLAVVVVVLVVVGVVVVAVAHTVNRLLGSSPDYSGSGSGTVTVVVADGQSAGQIGATLARDGVVRSAGAFTAAAAADTASRGITPGTYRLRRHMKASLALDLILSPTARISYRVTIPEGFTEASIVSRIAADTPISTASLKAALGKPSSVGLPTIAKGNPEGFLFPATYDVEPGETATQLLSAMTAAYDREATTLKLTSDAAAVHLTAYQAVTLASMVQREGRLTTDFPKIAEVFENRLAAGMVLGSDATLYYVLGANHGPLTATDLASNSPYNTRKFHGLPPTPINSPGAAALEAVLHPAKGTYLYFVTIDKAGHTAFARTLNQFNKLVAKSRANGVS